MKRWIAISAMATSLLCSFTSSVPACDFCLLSQGISPLDTMKGSGIKVSERYTLLDQVYQGTRKQPSPGAREEHWTTEFTGFYGITPAFMLLAVIPYKNGRTNGELMLNPDGTPSGLDAAGAGKASGLGDVALMGRYTFVKQEKPESTNIMAGLAGIKFATGGTNAKTSDGLNFLDSHLQPGTGSTDYFLGLSFSHSLERFSLSANLLGTITTAGKFGDTAHEFGNALNYDFSGKYRLYPEAFSPLKPQWFIALGLNGELREREKVAGDTDPDSGGNTIYVSPGLQVVFAPHWVVELSYQHAVYHNLYGTQLGETYKAIGGVTYLF
jgi:hypothetical protein